jgi:RNA polymerase sigma-70 factor, ECF subfamily
VSDSVAARYPIVPLGESIAEEGVARKQALPAEETSDEALLSCVKEGNRQALSMLFMRYANLIRGVGKKILRDRAEAEDLVQEVFLYIYRRSNLFDSTKGRGRSWIMQVAYTQAFLRRRELKSHGFYLSGIPDALAHGLHGAENRGAYYDQTVEGLFGRSAWRKILQDLTDDQRETLRLHFFEGHTFAEIAEKLGQSYANIRNHHYRALEKLRKNLHAAEFRRR